MDEYRSIDESVKIAVKQYSMPDLIRRLFPDCKVRDRGVFSSPFREDRHPSFSCFVGRGNVWIGKDQATNEVFDNISLYQKAVNEPDYMQALDDLALLVLGRNAVLRHQGREPRVRRKPVRIIAPIGAPEKDRESALKVVTVLPLTDERVPRELVRYWRSRGLSDRNITSTCVYVVVENRNRKGHILMDATSGLPIVDDNGVEIRDDGIIDGYGIYNDIGGIVIREADKADRKGFKGSTSSFITTIYADGSRPMNAPVFSGFGDNTVRYARYDAHTRSVSINSAQRFLGVDPAAARAVVPFIEEWKGIVLNERDIKCISAVITALNHPLCGYGAIVEGMTDGLSLQEIQGMSGRGFRPGVDLIILNSISNIRWARPLMSLEREVRCYMDNDIRTGAGMRASDEFTEKLGEFTKKTGTSVRVFSVSDMFKPYNDVNDYLNALKRPASEQKKNLAAPTVKHRKSKSNIIKF